MQEFTIKQEYTVSYYPNREAIKTFEASHGPSLFDAEILKISKKGKPQKFVSCVRRRIDKCCFERHSYQQSILLGAGAY